MAYCTQADVEKECGGLQRLVELTDDARSGNLDQAAIDLLTGKIADADAWIDSYAQRRHAVPFASPSAAIKRLSIKETVYLLLSRRGLQTDDDEKAHERREHWLEGLAAGRVSPGTDPVPTKSTAVAAQVFDRSCDEDISIESLKGFW